MSIKLAIKNKKCADSMFRRGLLLEYGVLCSSFFFFSLVYMRN